MAIGSYFFPWRNWFLPEIEEVKAKKKSKGFTTLAGKLKVGDKLEVQGAATVVLSVFRIESDNPYETKVEVKTEDGRRLTFGVSKHVTCVH